MSCRWSASALSSSSLRLHNGRGLLPQKPRINFRGFYFAHLSQKERTGHDSRSPPKACTALSLSNNRRRGFALADVLCEGRDAEKSHRRCRQYSEYFHGTPPFVMTQEKTNGITLPRVLKRNTEKFRRWLIRAATGSRARRPIYFTKAIRST